MKILTIIIPFILISCANIEERNKKRDLQSKILRLLASENKRFAKCATNYNIFSTTGKTRVKVDMQITLNSDGQVNKFEILNNIYSDKFSDCMFKVTDLIDFPRLEENEVVELVQPFVFSK